MAWRVCLVHVAAIVGSLLVSIPALAQVPPEFHGVWSFSYGKAFNCKKTDEGEGIFRIHRQGHVGYEDFCKLIKFESYQLEGQKNDENTGSVELHCGEGGGMWRSKEIWHVRTVNGTRILVMTTLQRTEEKNENDKTPFGPYKPRVYVSMSYECK